MTPKIDQKEEEEEEQEEASRRLGRKKKTKQPTKTYSYEVRIAGQSSTPHVTISVHDTMALTLVTLVLKAWFGDS
jgi:hypothetical protein